jgi:hypothetical protein
VRPFPSFLRPIPCRPSCDGASPGAKRLFVVELSVEDFDALRGIEVASPSQVTLPTLLKPLLGQYRWKLICEWLDLLCLAAKSAKVRDSKWRHRKRLGGKPWRRGKQLGARQHGPRAGLVARPHALSAKPDGGWHELPAVPDRKRHALLAKPAARRHELPARGRASLRC